MKGFIAVALQLQRNRLHALGDGAGNIPTLPRSYSTSTSIVPAPLAKRPEALIKLCPQYEIPAGETVIFWPNSLE